MKTDTVAQPVEKSLEVTVKRKITYKEIAYLLCSAFEGGSNYWATIVKETKPKKEDKYKFVGDDLFNEGSLYSTPFSKGGSILIGDCESENPKDENESQFKASELNLESIQKGLEIMAEKYPDHFNDFVNDSADATTGDVFLQCCILGDIVFG